MKAVRGDRGRIDDASHPRLDCRLEGVARSLEVHGTGLLGTAKDDEREVYEDVGAFYERIHTRTMEHVSLAVLGSLPPELLGVRRPSRHPDDPADLA